MTRESSAWTGAWTGPPDNPSAMSAISAITRAIGAASAHGARGHTSHNPPVVGSSPTRPTRGGTRRQIILATSPEDVAKVIAEARARSAALGPVPVAGGSHRRAPG